MAWETTHKAGSGVNGTAIAGVVVRQARSKWALEVQVDKGTGCGELIGVAGFVEREDAGTSISNGWKHWEVMSEFCGTGGCGHEH